MKGTAMGARWTLLYRFLDKQRMYLYNKLQF